MERPHYLDLANDRAEEVFRSHCMKAGGRRRPPVPMTHRNDGVNSWPRDTALSEKRAAAGSQITIDYHPNGVE